MQVQTSFHSKGNLSTQLDVMGSLHLGGGEGRKEVLCHFWKMVSPCPFPPTASLQISLQMANRCGYSKTAFFSKFTIHSKALRGSKMNT